MTKFARLRVDVPVDDGLPVDQVRDHLHAFLEQRGTEPLELASVEGNGAELPDAAIPRVGRIHWPAVGVVLHTERMAAAPKPPAKAAARKAATGGPPNG